MPGYLPESDAGTFATFAEARCALLADMETHEDSLTTWTEEHNCDDIPCPTYGEGCSFMMAGEVRFAAEDLDATLPSETEWGGYGGNLAYWIHECHETICLDDEDQLNLSIALHPANYATRGI